MQAYSFTCFLHLSWAFAFSPNTPCIVGYKLSVMLTYLADSMMCQSVSVFHIFILLSTLNK